MSAQSERLHVLVIGAGPIGLQAALQATALGCRVTVIERGRVAEHLRQWGHVRLFTPWSLNQSELGRERLRSSGTWSEPDPDTCPTGLELVEQYLEPLASLPELQGAIQTGTEVVCISRDGLLKSEAIMATGDRRRSGRPFVVLVESDGEERTIVADVILDASGVFSNPNAVGRGGAPARGERANRAHMVFGVPDVEGKLRERFVNRRTVVVGAGASAATTVRALSQLPGAEIFWVTRQEGAPMTPIPNDPLPERANLIAEANVIEAKHPGVTHLPGSSVVGLTFDGKQWRISLLDSSGFPTELISDEVVAQTGFRPDHSFSEELQFHECYASQGPMKLAGALLAAAGAGGDADCMKQISHGAQSLENPEPGFFVIGHKSYGRGANFLLRIGYEQVQDVFNLLNLKAEVRP